MAEQDIITYGGLVTSIEAGSFAEKLGIVAGDIVLEVNGEPVEDVIDVQFYASEYTVEMLIERDGTKLTLTAERTEMQPLGINFEHPTFDIDIRRCDNLCEFCFVLQMPKRFRRTLYIKDDDYRYSFLFGHFVTLTNLSEHDEWRIVEQGLSPLYVSVHDVDLKRRRAYLRNDNAPDIIEQMAWLIEEGIEIHTQIVVTPEVNDGEYLEESVMALAELYPGVQSISIVPVGLTRHHKYGLRTNTVEEANAVLDECAKWQEQFKAELGTNFVFPTDEWFLVTERPIPEVKAYEDHDLRENGLGMVRYFMEDWAETRQELKMPPIVNSLTLGTARLFAPTLSRFAQEFSALSTVDVNVVSITNIRLGEGITVAGLLMAEDVIAQLTEAELGAVVVLPRVMFDHPDGISLDDKSPMDVARALGRPVALADLMGDLVDIVYGKPALLFDPAKGEDDQPDNISKDGGWAVEKYL